MYFLEWLKYVWKDESHCLFFFSMPLYIFMSWIPFCGKIFTFSSDLCPFWHNVFSAVFPALLSSQNSHINTQKKVKWRYQALIWDVQINTGEIKVGSSMHKETSMVILPKLEIFPLVLIPVADMLQGPLIGILMASLCLSTLVMFLALTIFQHFGRTFCTNQSA